MIDADKALARARDHCFNAGVGDGATELCAAAAQFGVAKIQAVQRELGLEPDAMFVGAPDATVTRNRARWSQGFGYGGSYSWGGDFAVLDVKPNCCGMMVGLSNELPPPEDVRAALVRLAREPLDLEGFELDWDFDVGNHFVDLCHVERASEPVAGQAFILHTAGRELRSSTRLGPGLYYDKSAELRRMAREVATPWGSLSILAGDDARSWYEFYAEAEAFAARRRQTLARHLLGDHRAVCDVTHQGLVRGVNQANLGCYTFDSGGEAPLFPLTLSKNHPAYLVRGRPGFSPAAMEALGWVERAERLGLAGRLADANVLPHGGGYAYPGLVAVEVVDRGTAGRGFALTWDDGRREEIADPRDLPYTFRAGDVLDRVVDLGLGDIVAELRIDHAIEFTARP